MENLWILSVKTSLPNVCEAATDIKTELRAFTTFAAAKQALGETLHGLAFTKNAMFDGEGNMIHFVDYIDRAWEPDEDEELYEDSLTKTGLKKVHAAIKAIFNGESVDISAFAPFATDWLIAVEVKDDTLIMHGEDDGPCNGYDPQFVSNMFDMSEEKDYMLYIDDAFGQDDSTAEVYIDLKRLTIE